VPSSARSEGPSEPPKSDRPVLRLALSSGHLAIELEAPFSMGPLEVAALRVLLSDVRFPVDLTGGVAKFRHRRGRLERVELSASAPELARALAPRVTGLVGGGNEAPRVVIAPTLAGALVGIAHGASALAFDVLVAPMGGDLRLLVDAPRGVGLGAPAFVVALRVLSSSLKGVVEIRDGAIVLPDLAGEIARHVLPAAGARAPSVEAVEMELLGTMRANESTLPPGRLGLSIERGREPPVLGARPMAALELALLAGSGDMLALAGDLDGARSTYLGALERAPRHPELALRLAAIDLTAGGRADAALSTIVEAMDATDAGALGAELLLATGDRDGAFAALRRAAAIEPFGPLSALEWLKAAEIAPRAELREEAIDQALARSPGSALARWERLTTRLARADLRGALADAEHLEADGGTAEARIAVCMKAGALFAERGYVKEAKTRFERALRYRPQNAEAVLALARSLRDLGQSTRALDLFARASALAEHQPVTLAEADLSLAHALAEIGQNVPAAIARAARVPPEGARGLEARALEGKLRASIGDLVGASRVFARLRAIAEVERPDQPEAPRAARWLLDAAKIEESELGDLAAAQQCVGLAMRFAPSTGSIAGEFRRLSKLLREQTAARAHPPVEERVPKPATEQRAPEKVEFDEAEIANRIEELTSRLRANPRDASVADALADLLERAGQDLELLSLLSARIDEADEAERPQLEANRQRVLARLAQTARNAGRAAEADLYESMLDPARR